MKTIENEMEEKVNKCRSNETYQDSFLEDNKYIGMNDSIKPKCTYLTMMVVVASERRARRSTSRRRLSFDFKLWIYQILLLIDPPSAERARLHKLHTIIFADQDSRCKQ